VDVLVHVLVQHRDRRGVGRIAASAGNFAVLDPGELVVLLPEVGLDQLGRGQEAQNRRVAFGEAAAREGRCRMASSRPAPRVPAPSTAPLTKKERRLVTFSACSFGSMSPLSECGSLSGLAPDGLVSSTIANGPGAFIPKGA